MTQPIQLPPNRLTLTFIAELPKNRIVCLRVKQDGSSARTLHYYQSTPMSFGLSDSEIKQFNFCRKQLNWR